MKYRYLSYALKNKIPVYGGEAKINFRRLKSIKDGDSSNMYHFGLANHWGTHIDFPNHFFEKGPKVLDYLPGFWFFKSPQVVKIHLEENEILRCGNWLNSIKHDTDILLLKSGWSKFRCKRKYSLANPGINPDVAHYLRKSFKNLRALGIDWVSVSPYRNRHLGQEAHKAFLNPDENPIILIEDMNLSVGSNKVEEILAVPLLVDKIDSVPCTVIGLFKND